VTPESKLRDLYNILHLPYTAMVLAFVLAGAAAAPHIHLDRLAGTLLAYFVGLGIGVHALDQLEPAGSHYVERLGSHELVVMAILGLGGAAAIGLYFTTTVTEWLFPLIAAGLFFAVAYPLPSRVGHGWFHNDLSFSFSWGFLPLVTSYFVNSVELTPLAVGAGTLAALAAAAEIRLSRRARAARKEALPGASFGHLESELKLLVTATCSVALLMTAAKLV